MSSRQSWAFGATPFLAAAIWYILMLAHLGIANGGIRLLTDVVTMGIGAFTLGLLVAAVATLALALPIFALLNHRDAVGPAITIAAGALIGILTSLILAGITADASLLPPGKGVLVGVATAALWWRLAEKPQRVAT